MTRILRSPTFLFRSDEVQMVKALLSVARYLTTGRTIFVLYFLNIILDTTALQ